MGNFWRDPWMQASLMPGQNAPTRGGQCPTYIARAPLGTCQHATTTSATAAAGYRLVFDRLFGPTGKKYAQTKPPPQPLAQRVATASHVSSQYPNQLPRGPQCGPRCLPHPEAVTADPKRGPDEGRIAS